MSRDLSQTVVHIDCDAFYAAVEELDRPEFKHVPMAVGKGVLTTCNYHARKFGCRSGMAGFVAMKLCPNLICLPLNFAKYTAKAQEVREIIAEYDPRFESASIDEAYLNITEYCEEKDMDAEDVVTQLRNEVVEKTHITISAGIAANAKLAKIASNMNKPNGQFRVANDRATILAFMRDLPTRKVNGVGRVFERELDAIGVKTCGNIYAQRAYLSKLFGEKGFQFLMQCHLGLGRTKIQPAEEYERKSVGTESTFRDMSEKTELREKLRWIAEELEKDLTRTQFKGRTLVLKVKLHTYEVLTRQTIPPKAVSTADDLYTFSLPMMTKLEKEIPNMTLRLMGLRCANLVSTRKTDTDFFGLRRFSSTDENTSALKSANEGEWEVWPEEEFEAAARQEREEEMNELERLSQEQQQSPPPSSQIQINPSTQQEDLEASNRLHKHGREILPNPTPKTSNLPKTTTRELGPSVGFQKPPTNARSKSIPQQEQEQEQRWTCPICARPQSASDRDFNNHIDFCLSKQTIREAVRDTSPESPLGGEQKLVVEAVGASARKTGNENGNGCGGPSGSRIGALSGRGRGRPKGKRKGEIGVEERGNKRLFFGVKGA